MSLESDVGHITRDIMESVSDAVVANLTVVLKREMNLTDDQILKISAVVKSTIESIAFNGMNQYISVFNSHQKTMTPPKKTGIFG
jgi:hypothetical protein